MANNRTADQLLKWGLQNAPANPDGTSSVTSVTEDVAAGRRPDLADPGLYDAIMGKSEAQMMQEELSVAMDTSRTVEDRCTALDNFEMLIEQVDNANSMEPMRMWPAVLSLLRAPEPAIQLAAAWVVGTAVQNNDKAQAVALRHGVLAPLMQLHLSPYADVRSKGVYALSAMLRHYPAAVAQFAASGGWAVIERSLYDDSLNVRRKLVFLLNSLLLQDPNDPAHGIVAMPEQKQEPVYIQGRSDAPYEETRATLDANAHPNVAAAMIENRMHETLLASLLGTGTVAAEMCGSVRVRDDEDFFEKAAQTIVTLVAKLQHMASLPQDKLEALLRVLEAPVDGAQTRAQQAGIDVTPLRTYLGI